MHLQIGDMYCDIAEAIISAPFSTIWDGTPSGVHNGRTLASRRGLVVVLTIIAKGSCRASTIVSINQVRAHSPILTQIANFCWEHRTQLFSWILFYHGVDKHSFTKRIKTFFYIFDLGTQLTICARIIAITKALVSTFKIDTLCTILTQPLSWADTRFICTKGIVQCIR